VILFEAIVSVYMFAASPLAKQCLPARLVLLEAAIKKIFKGLFKRSYTKPGATLGVHAFFNLLQS